jgi:hypothetical protein
MRSRLLKEIRSLLPLWGVAAAAGCSMPLCLALQYFLHEKQVLPPGWEDVFRVPVGFAAFAFFGCLAMLAAASFGNEFQHRTLALLVAQPAERSRLWNEKAAVVTFAVAAALLLHWLSRIPLYLAMHGSGVLLRNDPVLFATDLAAVIFLLATLCSAGFWTLVARSTMGGLVFSVASLCLTAMLVTFGLQKIYGEELAFESHNVAAVMACGGLAYSALFLWLGWRRFKRMELRDAVFGEGIELSGAAVRGKWWCGWLVCRPQGGVFNLVRKELRLQKPVFLSAAVFSVCGLVGLGLHRLWPEQGYNHFLELLLFFYVPLTVILAGCISLTEEKTLGVAAWHLTLPSPTRRMWVVKLAVANLSGLALGFVLPCLLGLLVLITDPTAQNSNGPDGRTVATLFFIAWLTILVSFWASTIMNNVIRSALTTIIALAVGGTCVGLGVWGGQTLDGPDSGLQTGLLAGLMVRYQLPPQFFASNTETWAWFGTFLAAVLLVSILLWQSLVHFRSPDPRRETLVKYSFLMAALILGCAFWGSDFRASAEGLYRSGPVWEVEAALSHFSAKEELWANAKPRNVTLAELKQQTADLSPATENWLRNAVITCKPTGNGFSRPGEKVWLAYFLASIAFPNGRHCEIAYTVSVPPKL